MLAIQNITKKFAGVSALQSVSLDILPGKVTAIIGENGAGKSTLMKILSGVYPDYEGSILLHGKEVRFSGTRDAQAHGIGIIHQELNLIPYLSITENIFLGRELTNRWGLLDQGAMREKTVRLLKKLKLPLYPDALVSDLKVGQQQVVEIAKALLAESHVIIMDEPTSAISESEVKVLFSIIRELKAEGKAIVYISHKLDELFAIADCYTVLRDGRSIESGTMEGMTQDKLIRKMVGREIKIVRRQDTRQESKELFCVTNLSLRHPDKQKEPLLQNISFSLHRGEILGLFGLMGAGRTELLETMFGLHAARSGGSMRMEGKPVIFSSPGQAIRAGLALVPEDRKRDGLVPGMDVQTNISLSVLKELETGGLLRQRAESELAKKWIGDMGIRTASAKLAVRQLSGGNQQKIVLAKWLATKPNMLMLDEPTRGIDIHAKAEIYKIITALATRGLGILVVSSELPEILALSDRVLVMAGGRLTANLPAGEATENNILSAAIPKTD